MAAGRAQLQQEPSAETTEGTGIGISISCSHPNIRTSDFIHWYHQLAGRGPAFLVSGTKGSQELRDPAGRLSVAADRRSSALWLARPRRGDAAVYYCALGDTGRGAGAAAGQEPRRAGPGVCVGGGGTAPGGPARGRCPSARPRPAPRRFPHQPAPAPARASASTVAPASPGPPWSQCLGSAPLLIDGCCGSVLLKAATSHAWSALQRESETVCARQGGEQGGSHKALLLPQKGLRVRWVTWRSLACL